jgi:hypothetical protein
MNFILKAFGNKCQKGIARETVQYSNTKLQILSIVAVQHCGFYEYQKACAYNAYSMFV